MIISVELVGIASKQVVLSLVLASFSGVRCRRPTPSQEERTVA